MRISVITTCFNAAETIRVCLESVKEQTYPDVEHIIVDAASTDGTLDVLKEYREHLANVISEPDSGIYDGMNKGLRLATGDVVGILNADDVYFGPDTLKKVARVFERHHVDSCYGDLLYVTDKEGTVFKACGPEKEDCKIVRYWKAGDFDPKKFFWGWMPPHPTFFVRRSVYKKYGYFNTELGTASDYEMMLRFLLRHEISVAYVPEILIAMRSGGASNVTLQARMQANRMDRRAWRVNGLTPHPWTLWMKPLRKIGQWFSRPKP